MTARMKSKNQKNVKRKINATLGFSSKVYASKWWLYSICAEACKVISTHSAKAHFGIPIANEGRTPLLVSLIHETRNFTYQAPSAATSVVFFIAQLVSLSNTALEQSAHYSFNAVPTVPATDFFLSLSSTHSKPVRSLIVDATPQRYSFTSGTQISVSSQADR